MALVSVSQSSHGPRFEGTWVRVCASIDWWDFLSDRGERKSGRVFLVNFSLVCRNQHASGGEGHQAVHLTCMVGSLSFCIFMWASLWPPLSWKTKILTDYWQLLDHNQNESELIHIFLLVSACTVQFSWLNPIYFMAAVSENQYGKKHTWGAKRPKNIPFGFVGRSPWGPPLFQAPLRPVGSDCLYGTVHRLVFAIHIGLKFLSVLKCLLNKCS